MTSENQRQYQNLIVGAGPSGLQLAYYFDQAKRDYLVLESGDGAGTFFKKFPRHKTLLSINKRFNFFPERDFNLRHDWNSLLSADAGPRFTEYSEKLYPLADELVAYLQDYADNFSLHVRYGCHVEQIESVDDGGFLVRTGSAAGESDEYRCHRLFLATGAIGPWISPEIEGIDLAEGYEDHPIDPTDYQNQRVAVIGQGNSAFEVANHLAGHAAIIHIFVNKQVNHAWATHYPGDLRAINNTVLDMYQLKSLHATVGFRVKSIRERPPGCYDLLLETEFRHWDPPRLDQATFTYDRVIRCTGWRYADTSLFSKESAPELDAGGKFFALSPTWETSIPGLYCVGTSMQQRDRKAATSFIHGFRYNVRTLFRLLEERDFGVPYSEQTFPLAAPADLDDLAAFLVRRISLTSALFQQFGVLGDVLAIQDGCARLYYELPVDHVWERTDLKEAQTVVVLTLEYGFHHYPHLHPLNFILPPDFGAPECGAFLHPVLRRYDGGEMVEELHINESLVVRYDIHYDNKLDVGGHQNRIRNFFNRITGFSNEVFSEDVYDSEVPTELRLSLSDEETGGGRTGENRCRFLVRTR